MLCRYTAVNIPGKVLSIDDAVRAVREAQAHGRTVAMCHGCFDLVHPGHVRHLQHAATLADHLLVTVTSDVHVGKGVARPLIPQELRAENLAALDCVDWVAINPAATAAELLERVQPDIYVKGREYEQNHDPRFLIEKETVERHGGRVVFSSGDVVFSSTALISTLEDNASPVHASVRGLLRRHALTPASAERLIASFQGRTITVIGEIIRDTYVMCERPAIAGESPMMTLRPMESRGYDGGAAIMARHAAAMGAKARILTVLPRTTDAQAMRERLQAEGVETIALEHEAPIVEKQRFLVGATKVMKLDLGKPLTLDAANQRAFTRMAVEAAQSSDAVIIADFGQGLFTPALMRQVCMAVRPHARILTGDVSGRRANLLSMREMDLVCPSESEIRDSLHDYDDGLSSVVWRLLEMTASRAAMATLAEEGLIVFERTADSSLNPEDWRTRLTGEHVPALASHAIDPLGCGDALLVAATLAIACGASPGLAGLFGSIAASVQAQRLGNAVISSADLRKGFKRLCDSQLTCERVSVTPAQAGISPALVSITGAAV